MLTPILARKFVPAQSEEKEPRMRALSPRCTCRSSVALGAQPRWPSRLPVVIGMFSFRFLGGEFMPNLEEGNFWIRATLHVDLPRAVGKYVGRMREILRGYPETQNVPCDDAHRKHPEVKTVVSQLGRPDDGTDVAGFQNIEFFVPLSPSNQWPRGITKDKLNEGRTSSQRLPRRRLQLLAGTSATTSKRPSRA